MRRAESPPLAERESGVVSGPLTLDETLAKPLLEGPGPLVLRHSKYGREWKLDDVAGMRVENPSFAKVYTKGEG